METGWLFNPLELGPDGRPQEVEAFATGHLNTPVALGNVPSFYHAESRAAEFVMRDVIARLKHGLLYGGYNTDISESGPGAGSWQALNAMFPITPRELHPGWIVGEERTITTVSGSYSWSGDASPIAKCFDLEGAVTACSQAEVSEGETGWTLELVLDDWNQVAVIDETPVPIEVLALWSMDDALSGPAKSLLDSKGNRDLDRAPVAPSFSDDSPPEGVAFTTGWDGAHTGLYQVAPGFVDVNAWTFEVFFRRADEASAGCFFGNGHVQDYAGIARVCVRADVVIEIKLVGETVSSTGNPYDLVTFIGPDDAHWHHLAVTWSDDLVQAYLDHNPIGDPLSTQYYQGRLLTDYAYLTVGFANDTTDSPGAHWHGDLDAIRLSKESLIPERFLPLTLP